MSSGCERIALAVALTAALASPGGAHVPLPGGRVTISTPDGEVGAATRAAFARLATAPRLAGKAAALRVRAQDGVAHEWTLDVLAPINPVRVAAALVATSRDGWSAADPGLFADLDTVFADAGARTLTLRFLAPTCSPRARLAAWHAPVGALDGARAPFRALRAGSYTRDPEWAGAVYLDRLDVATGVPASPRSGEIALAIGGGDGPAHGVFVCRLLAECPGGDAREDGRLTEARRLLGPLAFAPLVAEDDRCRWFRDREVQPIEGAQAPIDSSVSLRGTRVAVALQATPRGPSTPRELSELVARRTRVLLEAEGCVVVAESAAPDLVLRIASRAFLAFGPAGDAILDGHARIADAAWTVLALGLEPRYASDVRGNLHAPETLWLVMPAPDR